MQKSKPCRYFNERGGCRYGAQCKFSHASQPQQQSNAYGFGMQNHSPARNTFFGTNFNQKEKENRFSPLSTAGLQGSKQNGSTPSVQEHKCDDPNACKQLILEDSKSEEPLWKLTCYGHWKYLPCDIRGDISYEELRCSAYEDAKQGLPLEQIVQRERSLVSSKIEEFNNLRRNPYNSSTKSAFDGLGSPTLASGNLFQNNTPAFPQTSNQFGSQGSKELSFSNGFGGNANPASFGFGNTPSNNSSPFQNSSPFGASVSQPGLSGSSFQSSSPFGTSVSQPGLAGSPFQSSSPFGTSVSQPGLAGSPNQISSAFSFGVNNNSFQSAASFKSPAVNQFSFGNADNKSNANSFGNSSSALTTFSNFGSMESKSPRTGGLFNVPDTRSGGFLGTTSPPAGISLATSAFNSSNNLNDNSSVRDEIWFKESWTLEEIPEDEPPPYARC